MIPVRAASLDKVFDYDDRNLTFYKDITGDGKKDEITVKTNLNQYDMIQSTQVFVKGKKALTITKNAGYYYSVDVNYLKMSKSKEFLQIIGYGDNEWRAVNAIYRYDKKNGKLKKVLDLTNGINSASDVVKVTSKNIQVQHSYQPTETGWVNWKYTYIFKNGKFKLKKSTASVKSSLNEYDNGDGYFKYFKDSKFKASKSLTFYTSTSQKKKAFTAKKGSVLKLKKIKVSGKKVYTDQGTGWFYGVACRLAG